MGNNTSSETETLKRRTSRKSSQFIGKKNRQTDFGDSKAIAKEEAPSRTLEIKQTQQQSQESEFIESKNFVEHIELGSRDYRSDNEVRQRRSSNSSSFDKNTIHDDLINKDDEEIEANALLDYMSQDYEFSDIRVPVAVSWKGAAKEVYITGSFTQWVQKIQLNQVAIDEFQARLYLPIGFYRFKFIVDGETKVSNKFSKATEANGDLINWFEVVKGTVGSDTFKFGTLSHEKLFNVSTNCAPHEFYTGIEPPEIRRPDYFYSGKITTDNSDDYFGPISDDLNSLRIHSSVKYMVSTDQISTSGMWAHNSPGFGPCAGNIKSLGEPILTPILKSSEDYTTDIPTIFVDTDDFDETLVDGSTMLKRKGIKEPPTLPPYLNNVLLNNRDAQTYARKNKVESNVLSVPNHVILNHLITTSIRGNVLAVACINRYVGKFITQVIYSPVEEL